VFSAVDHSAFYVPGTIFDSRYHFSHHYGNINKNLAEMEIIDHVFQTYEAFKLPVYKQVI